MLKNPWFTLVLGLMLGFAVGFALGELQPVRPASAVGMPPQPPQQSLPEGHPPIEQGTGMGAAPAAARVQQQVRELEAQLAKDPGNPHVMVALANVHFDAGQWSQARDWYEKALKAQPNDPNVKTDLAIVYRSLKDPTKALALLDEVIAQQPDHWQAWYNKAVILHFDQGRHDEAVAALDRLKQLKAANPGIGDFSPLEREILGQGQKTS